MLFASWADCEVALLKDRANMGKRYIVVKPSSRYEYYQAAAARFGSERQEHSYSVIKMRGLPFNVTYEDIIAFFSPGADFVVSVVSVVSVVYLCKPF